MDKKRSIGAAAKELGLPEHVIRFWETQFPDHIKPTLGAGGRRYYYNKDIEIIQKIKSYLYDSGYTIKGLQNLLKNRSALNDNLNIHVNNIVPNNTIQEYQQHINYNARLPEEEVKFLKPQTKIVKEYVYLDKGLNETVKKRLTNFKKRLLDFIIKLENI